MKQYGALAMFSGGLDSILAARTVMAQGIDVLCLHFTSPFFGHPDKIEAWEREYGLTIKAVDIGREYVDMMLAGPPHGVGKGLNPCVDCKILMLGRCRELLEVYGATFIITGEVKGQRPMSQRRDALDVISRDARVRDVLLRPLCARTMNPTPMEESGLVDRERLHNFGGRSRRPQMGLARALGISKIPQPAGGCKLTEFESAKRYMPLFLHAKPPRAEDFHLANVGRQFWSGGRWLAMGRDKAGNQMIAALAEPGDVLLAVRDYPGPLGLIRELPDAPWREEDLLDAAALLASYSPKAVALGREIGVTIARAANPDDASAREARLGTFGIEADMIREAAVTPRREPAAGLCDVSWEEYVPIKRRLFGENPEDDGY
jgi:hypothetical protein